MRELMTDELDAISGGDSIVFQPANSQTVIQIACPVGYLVTLPPIFIQWRLESGRR
jgi:hypothetical protein